VSNADAQHRYERARGRLEAVYAEWERQGGPLTSPGARGSIIVHPLLREIRVLELAVDRLHMRAHPGRVGRPPSAVPGLPPPLEERRVRRVK
jgi:hypothetical protein